LRRDLLNRQRVSQVGLNVVYRAHNRLNRISRVIRMKPFLSIPNPYFCATWISMV
jgi:hypothetical protein